MNIGIKRSHAGVIIRMDAQAEYSDDYVAASVAVLRRTAALDADGADRSRASASAGVGGFGGTSGFLRALVMR